MPAMIVKEERGATLLITFMMMLAVSGLAVAVAIFARNSQLTGQSQLLDKQAYYVAEAGWQRARQALSAATWQAALSSGTTYTESFGAGEYSVTLVDEEATLTENGDAEYTITVGGYVPTIASYAARRQIIEDDLDATVTNTNHSSTATASASSSNGSHTAGEANDDADLTDTDPEGYWEASTNGSGQWLKFEYTASPPTLNKLYIDEHDRIDGITVEWSDDNSAWSTPSNLSVVETTSKKWTATFDAMAHRYIRLTFTASGSSRKVSVDEWYSYHTASRTATLSHGDFTTSW
jgi:hypothetical protein